MKYLIYVLALLPVVMCLITAVILVILYRQANTGIFADEKMMKGRLFIYFSLPLCTVIYTLLSAFLLYSHTGSLSIPRVLTTPCLVFAVLNAVSCAASCAMICLNTAKGIPFGADFNKAIVPITLPGFLSVIGVMYLFSIIAKM